VAGNGFDRVSAGLRTGIGGKTGKERGSSGQCVGFGEDSGVFGVKKGTQLRSNAAGLDAKGRLFVLYPRGECRKCELFEADKVLTMCPEYTLKKFVAHSVETESQDWR